MRKFLLLAFLLTGCGGPRDLNPPSRILIRTAPLPAIHAHFPDLIHPAAVTALTGARIEVWIPEDMGTRETIRNTVHELLKHVGPTLYPAASDAFLGLLREIDTPEFPVWECAERRPQ